jgi:hypothetical protein
MIISEHIQENAPFCVYNHREDHLGVLYWVKKNI